MIGALLSIWLGVLIGQRARAGMTALRGERAGMAPFLQGERAARMNRTPSPFPARMQEES